MHKTSLIRVYYGMLKIYTSIHVAQQQWIIGWRKCNLSKRGESALASTVDRLALDCMQARHRGDIDDVAMPAQEYIVHHPQNVLLGKLPQSCTYGCHQLLGCKRCRL